MPSVLLSRKRPASMVAWLGTIVFLPFVGPLLYLFFGSDRLLRKRLARHREAEEHPGAKAADFNFTPADADLARTVAQVTANPLTSFASLDLLGDAATYYDDWLGQIDAARHHVHAQTYVWRHDEFGRRLLAALCRAARRGVAVRLLVDELGTLEVDEKFFHPLRDAGGEFSWCDTLHPRRNRYFLNLRNHRKLQIVDGRQAWIGGMNIGREYAGRDPEIGEWHDLQVRVTGAALAGLQESFANDWFFATQQEFSGDDYFPRRDDPPALPALIIESGPDSERHPFLKSVIALCNSARESVDLFTPYFIPVPSLITAFQLAAARGVRVRLMISEKSDHRFLVKIGRSYYEQLMEFGVEIYEYGDAVHHAKVNIADHRWLMIGSGNLDARSFDLNFELNVLTRAPEICARLDTTYDRMFAASRRIDLDTFRRRPRRQKLTEGLSRLWAPLL